MAYEESQQSSSTCDTFFRPKVINVDGYAQADGELPKMPMPATSLDPYSPTWSVSEQPIGSKAYTTVAPDSVRYAYRLRLGITVFRAITSYSPFKIQEVVFRVWPAGTTIDTPEASMTQEVKPAPLSTTGWAGTIRERRTLQPTKKTSGNR